MSAEDDRITDLIAEKAAEYYAARRFGVVTPKEEQEFLQWLQTSPVHVAEYLGIAALAKDLPGAAQQIDIPLETLAEDWRADVGVAAFPSLDAMRPTTDRKRSRLPYVLWGTLATACVALTAIGSLMAWRNFAGTEFATRLGEERTFQLSDNSVIHLNSQSAISVKFDDRTRLVELKRGQAYFEVAKDAAARPFGVRVGNTLIEDVGTTFDVFLKGGDAVVTVVEGQVLVRDATVPPSGGLGTETSLVADLRAGDQATVTSSGAVNTKRGVNTEKATAWTQREIQFQGETIGAVAEEFNRYNRIKIVVVDAGVANLAISGVFHAYDVNSFGQFLNSLPGVRAMTIGETMTVTTESTAAMPDEKK